MSLLCRKLSSICVAFGMLAWLPAQCQVIKHLEPIPLSSYDDYLGDEDASRFGQEVLEKRGLVIVEFMSPSCLACNPTARMLYHLVNKYDGKVLWFRLNIHKNPGLSDHYEVPKVPAVLLFKDGHLVKKFNAFNEYQRSRLAQVVDFQLEL